MFGLPLLVESRQPAEFPACEGLFVGGANADQSWISMIRRDGRCEGPGMPSIGPMELIIVLVLALVIFGPKRLPDLGRSLGNGMREFKNSVAGSDRDELPSSEQAPAEKI
jgi:sec-independent protein translocase protein TatA